MIRKLLTPAAIMLFLGTHAHAQENTLFNRVPAGANALVIIDVQRALASPVAIKEGWGNKKSDAPLFLTPSANRILFASQVDLTSMDAQWSVALLDLAKPPSLSAITLAESGYADMLGGKAAVHSDRNAFFIQLDTQVLGVVSPANRQFANRWAAIPPAAGALSPYLQSAASGSKGAIVMALDLTNAANPVGVRRTISADPSLLALVKDLDLKNVAETIGGIKGITVNVEITERVTVTATIEFSSSAGIISTIGQQLLMEMLAKNGMQLDDLKSWKATVSGAKLTTTGELTTASLRRLLSLIEPPTPQDPAEIPAAGAAAATTPADAKAEASRKYYKTISAMLDRYGSAPSLGDVAGWLKRDAQNIDRLSLVNVDPDLIKWGSEVAANLVQASGIAAVGQMQVSARAASANAGYDITSANAQNQSRQASMEAKAQASQEGVKFLGEALKSRSTVRAKMVARYNVDF